MRAERPCAASSGVGPQTRLFSALPPDFDPAGDLRLIGSGESCQFGLRPIPGRSKTIGFGQAEREPGVRGEQIRPVASDLSQLGHGCVRGVDPAPGAIAAADTRNPCRQELVSAAHIGSLEPRCSRNASGDWRASSGSRIGNRAQLGHCVVEFSRGSVRRSPVPGPFGFGPDCSSRGLGVAGQVGRRVRGARLRSPVRGR
jgi:hypothetical protein